MLNVSERTVKTAKKVQHDGTPELIQTLFAAGLVLFGADLFRTVYRLFLAFGGVVSELRKNFLSRRLFNAVRPYPCFMVGNLPTIFKLFPNVFDCVVTYPEHCANDPVSKFRRFPQLLRNKPSFLLLVQVPPRYVQLAGVGALFVLGQAGALSPRR